MKATAAVLFIVLLFLVLFGATGYLYFWVFSQSMFPGWIRIIIVVGTLGLMGALIAAGVQRVKEIREEAKDDLGKY